MAGLLSLSKHPAILLLTAGPFDFTQGSWAKALLLRGRFFS